MSERLHSLERRVTLDQRKPVLLKFNNIKLRGTKMKRLKSMIVILMILSLGFLTFSCNTMKGVGQDVEVAGKKIQKTAD